MIPLCFETGTGIPHYRKRLNDMMKDQDKTVYSNRTAELLSPAGSMEGLKAVLNAGADAVYLGGNAFGARAYAENFDREELLKAIDLVHLYGKKIYLTVNTLLKERELEEDLHDYLLPLYRQGLDAVLVQDFGVLRMIRREFPGMDIHASTQMAVTGPCGVRFLKEQGVKRVVLARELSLEEIRFIHDKTDMELETFVHGALCYSYSGRCLMSSLIGGRSGNRGRCAQPCRLEYKAVSEMDSRGEKKSSRIWNEKKPCPISLKDMNALEILPDILEAGVYSLKIEGRMRKPEYAAGVTSVYRGYLDRYIDSGREGYRVDPQDRQFLIDLFSRGGSSKGYYFMHNGPSMMAFTNEKKSNIEGSVPPRRKIPIRGEAVFRTGEPASLAVYADTDGREAGPVIKACGPAVQKAETHPLTEESVRRQLNRLGDTVFEWAGLEIVCGDDIFLPVKSLNDLRRSAIERLTESILQPYRRASGDLTEKIPEADKKEDSLLPGHGMQDNTEEKALQVYVSCEEWHQAEILMGESGITGLYVTEDAVDACLAIRKESGNRYPDLYLLLPQINRGEDADRNTGRLFSYLDRGITGFVVRDLEMYAAFCREGLSDRCVLDSSLYCWNSEAVRFFEENGCLRLTAPLELNCRELSEIGGRQEGTALGKAGTAGSRMEIPVYGYLPMMISAQCVRKNLDGCVRKKTDSSTGENRTPASLFLQDRLHASFPAVNVCRPWKGHDTDDSGYCYNIIYNSIPYGLLKDYKRVLPLAGGGIRISFTIEDPGRTREIFRIFRDVYVKGKEPGKDLTLTRGHFRRGVE